MIEARQKLLEQLHPILTMVSPVIRSDFKPRVPAAVLVPFCFIKGEWHLLFTKRTNGVVKHRGEISFPGGASEPADKDMVATAVRETCEEIGICRDSIQVLGVMEPVSTITNYCVLPVIGIIDWPIQMKLNPTEVESVHFIPVNWLKDNRNWHTEELFYSGGKSKQVIHFKDYDNAHLWGFTASLTLRVTSRL